MAEILGRRFKRWENNQGEIVEPGFGQALNTTPANPEPVDGDGGLLRVAEPMATYTVRPELVEGRGVGEEPVSTSASPEHADELLPPVRPELVEGRETPDDERYAGDEPEDDEAVLLGWGALPDLVIVDGGKGQLSAALDVMRNLGLKDVPLAGLAKQNEELFVQDLADPIVLPRTSQALYLVQRIRDEAHRFAITYHRQLRSKSGMQSALDSVPGIGPKRKRALLRKFGSLKGVREASVEEIASTVGFTKTLAEKVKESL
jgi:excinuclease ABC subunit C